jgi:hypothetical protein
MLPISSGGIRRLARTQQEEAMSSYLPMSIQRFVASLSIILLFSSLIPITGTGAQSPTAGAATGRIFEGNLLPLPGVKVTVVNEQNGNTRATITDATGTYRVQFLTPGTYSITASKEGFADSAVPVVVPLGSTKEIKPPDITLKPSSVSTTSVTPDPKGPEAGSLVNTIDATRSANFTLAQIQSLPLGGSTAMRTFDELAFLAPGVAPPPQAIGTSVGPGVGPGVGTSGQFSVNGMRSRSNNFTIDGADNNDEDIGVRRQGFTALVPQSTESVQELRLITLLPEPQFGRTPGAQVDAVSRSGGTAFHGTFYGFFTNRSLKARDPFDLERGARERFDPITRASDGVEVIRNGEPIVPLNPSEGENPFQRLQYGFAIGGPIIKNRLSFFGSYERQDLKAARESHFAVPTVAERGLTVDVHGQPLLTGDRGINQGGFRGGPTSLLGDAFFSFFPFPNNPLGPYGPNTFTEVLRADAKGNVLSGKLDWQNIKAFGKDHNLSTRYNFTDDDTILPVTGGAILSSLEPLVRTQNVSFIFDSILSPKLSNQFRASYGRTRLRFDEVPDPNLPKPASGNFPGVPFLLNANILRNITRVGFKPSFVNLTRDQLSSSCFNPTPKNVIVTTEDCIGPLGQLIVSGYSPVGVDVFSFQQSRVNNVFQYADTLISNWGKHQFTLGFDLRRVHLDSRVDRNFRPLAVFTGARSSISTSSSGIPLESELQGRDFVAVGAPTGFTQTLALHPDSMIQLRSWQNYFFFGDQIRLRNSLTVSLGATYQLNTVPTDTEGRIEKTFSDPQVKAIGIDKFLDRRDKIYRQDNNNIAPYISVAWDPFGKGETSIRAGYGIYYDQIPGAVISQSRSVFPSFFTFNLAGIDKLGFQPSGFEFYNPATVADPKTLNTFTPTALSNQVDIIASVNAALRGNFARPDFVLPAAGLVTPYAHHWGLTIEQELLRDFLLSVAYVGTRGVHLLRLATPNLGPNKIPIVTAAPAKLGEPSFQGGVLTTGDTLGSFTSIESDANSIYHALQVQLIKRFSHRVQLTAAYTWSHAIDEVSDIFDLAGAPALPQDSRNLKAERADANFDVRHRFVYSAIWDLPGPQHSLLLGNWQLASIGTFQTGQPYSVLYFYDVNQDGNLTDRVAPGGPNGTGTLAGQAGRNLFRAPGVATVDLAINKRFRLSERQNLEFRTEIFNLFNRSNFGIPVNQVNFGGLGFKPLAEQIFIDTRVPKRLIQFALKYNF